MTLRFLDIPVTSSFLLLLRPRSVTKEISLYPIGYQEKPVGLLNGKDIGAWVLGFDTMDLCIQKSAVGSASSAKQLVPRGI